MLSRAIRFGFVTLVCLPSWQVFAQDAPAKNLQIGWTIISGADDIVRRYRQNSERMDARLEGPDPALWPIGAVIHYRYPLNSYLSAGAGMGPLMFIVHEDASFANIPVTLDLVAKLNSSSKIKPYARAGVRHHLAGGEYVMRSRTGWTSGLGIMVDRGKIDLALEIGVDTGEIEFEQNTGNPAAQAEKIKPFDTFVSFTIGL